MTFSGSFNVLMYGDKQVSAYAVPAAKTQANSNGRGLSRVMACAPKGMTSRGETAEFSKAQLLKMKRFSTTVWPSQSLLAHMRQPSRARYAASVHFMVNPGK